MDLDDKIYIQRIFQLYQDEVLKTLLNSCLKKWFSMLVVTDPGKDLKTYEDLRSKINAVAEFRLLMNTILDNANFSLTQGEEDAF